MAPVTPFVADAAKRSIRTILHHCAAAVRVIYQGPQVIRSLCEPGVSLCPRGHYCSLPSEWIHGQLGGANPLEEHDSGQRSPRWLAGAPPAPQTTVSGDSHVDRPPPGSFSGPWRQLCEPSRAIQASRDSPGVAVGPDGSLAGHPGLRIVSCRPQPTRGVLLSGHGIIDCSGQSTHCSD